MIDKSSLLGFLFSFALHNSGGKSPATKIFILTALYYLTWGCVVKLSHDTNKLPPLVPRTLELPTQNQLVVVKRPHDVKIGIMSRRLMSD